MEFQNFNFVGLIYCALVNRGKQMNDSTTDVIHDASGIYVSKFVYCTLSSQEQTQRLCQNIPRDRKEDIYQNVSIVFCVYVQCI